MPLYTQSYFLPKIWINLATLLLALITSACKSEKNNPTPDTTQSPFAEDVLAAPNPNIRPQSPETSPISGSNADLCVEILDLVKIGQYEQASSHFPFAFSLEAFQKNMQISMATYGSINSHEFIKEEKFGNSISRYTYLTHHDSHFMVWGFDFYKTSSGWQLTKCTYADTL